MSTVATARQLCRDPHATRRKPFVPGAAVAHIARAGASPQPLVRTREPQQGPRGAHGDHVAPEPVGAGLGTLRARA